MNDRSFVSFLPLLTLVAVIAAITFFRRRSAAASANKQRPSPHAPVKSPPWLKFIAACVAVLLLYVSCNDTPTNPATSALSDESSLSALAKQSSSKSMSFDDCLRVIQNTATQLGVAPTNIVETSEMRMVRFPSSDGSVLVTCSRPDRKMVMTVSKK